MKKLRTPDFGLTTYLLAIGHRLLGNEREGRRVFFIFDYDDIEADARDYQNGEAVASVRRIYEAQRQVRSIIHEGI